MKSINELRNMTTEEIANYVAEIEEDESKANSIEYVEWCGAVLDEVLIEREIAPEDFENFLRR